MSAGVIHLVSVHGVSTTSTSNIGSSFTVAEHCVLRGSVVFSAPSKLVLNATVGETTIAQQLNAGDNLVADAVTNVSANLRPGVTYQLKNVGSTATVTADVVAVLAPVI